MSNTLYPFLAECLIELHEKGELSIVQLEKLKTIADKKESE